MANLKLVKSATALVLGASVLTSAVAVSGTDASAKTTYKVTKKGTLVNAKTNKAVKGYKSYKGKLYKNGKKFTGTYKSVFYKSGVKFTGTYNKKYYVKGKLFTGKTSKNVYYKKGVKFTGVTSYGYTYKAGKRVEGEYKGKVYKNGKLVTGVYKDVLYTKGVKETGLDLYKGKLYKEGVLNVGLALYKDKYYYDAELANGKYKDENGVEKLYKDGKIVDLAVESVSAINATQAVVTFNQEVGDVTAENFTADNNINVIKAEVSATDKKQVTLTFNRAFIDKDTYKVTVDGVKTAGGVALTEAKTAEFKYEVAAVKSVELSATKFYNGDSILDKVVVKDANGLVLDNSNLDIELASTDAVVNTTSGVVTTTTNKSFYVEVKVKDGSEVLATTGAVKVEVAPTLEISSFDGITIGDLTATSEVTDYTTLKTTNKLVTGLKVNKTGATLNLFAKDVDGNVVLVAPDADTKITNLTPTIANVAVANDKFVINTIATGKASAKIKVGDFETTISFDVTAAEKVSDAKLSTTKVALDTASNGTITSKDVTVSLLDQYGDAIVVDNADTSNDTASVLTYDDGSKLSVKSGNTRVATAEVAADGTVTIAKPAANALKGSTTVTVEYKNAAGTVVFTKSISVTASDFDTTVATYKLALDSTNTLLDADDDTDETGADEDDSVKLVLNKIDKYGNVIGQELAANVQLTATASNTKDQDFFEVSGDEVKFKAGANTKLANNGTVKITATVGGVAVDSLNVEYKNTDSVATKAVVSSSTKLVDLSNLGGTTVTVDDLLFGKLNTANTKYLLNPALTIQDQTGKTLAYDIANGVDLLKNGLKVVPTTPVLTNLDNVTNTSGILSLTDDSKSGSVTIVIPAVNTEASGATVNADLLAAPVSITVTLVK